MKKVMIFLGFVGFLMPAKAQYVSDCTVPETLRTHYAMDVADLALKWLYEIQSPDTSLIEIPSTRKSPSGRVWPPSLTGMISRR